jgi:BirA family transcriptional regulator, biotin operon repressor / biotin---[acetyl-CoA-carboxylase] ligase
MTSARDDAPDDPLDATMLRARLSPSAATAYAAIEVVDAIDSTNSELLRRTTPTAGIAALFAERQSGGRGRQGRVWASPPGANLYCSLARRFDGGLARLGGLSLAVGVAVAESLQALGATDVRAKWPNDLVVADGDALRKLGGILIEGGMQDGGARAVIGLGLNVRMPAEAANGIDQPWTDLHALLGDALPSRNAIAAAILTASADALERFDAEGLAPFLSRFAALDALSDTEISATVGGRIVDGIACGLTADGALRMRTGDGETTLRAGDVSVRRRTSALASSTLASSTPAS